MLYVIQGPLGTPKAQGNRKSASKRTIGLASLERLMPDGDASYSGQRSCRIYTKQTSPARLSCIEYVPSRNGTRELRCSVTIMLGHTHGGVNVVSPLVRMAVFVQQRQQ